MGNRSADGRLSARVTLGSLRRSERLMRPTLGSTLVQVLETPIALGGKPRVVEPSRDPSSGSRHSGDTCVNGATGNASGRTHRVNEAHGNASGRTLRVSEAHGRPVPRTARRRRLGTASLCAWSRERGLGPHRSRAPCATAAWDRRALGTCALTRLGTVSFRGIDARRCLTTGLLRGSSRY
jgi:hypothetical protein